MDREIAEPTKFVVPGKTVGKTTADREYEQSKSWKCSPSPTGAHHWIEHWLSGKSIWICKHCFKRKDGFDHRTVMERKREGVNNIEERNGN